MVALAKVNFEKDQRTCLVNSHTFTQRFRWVDDLGGRGAWVTEDKPTGPCGTIQLSRFEPDPTTKPSLRFWKYYARKAVTNPQGSMYGAMKCTELDQGTYPYDWNGPRETGMGCDYVSFGSF
ncbi:MAG: hypothetical protein KBA31_00820 [Alphaproteobacteria bacterium]|nr:hypothetical protein [Alphaproteobacteria bacterium]